MPPHVACGGIGFGHQASIPTPSSTRATRTRQSCRSVAAFRRRVQRLKGHCANEPKEKIAREVVELSRAGLARRARLDAQRRDETRFLEPVIAIADAGRSLAERLAVRQQGAWGGRIEPVFTELLL